MCSDGFNPFGAAGAQYSVWPVILTPYNLPPAMLMKEPVMFLTVLIPGPRSPRQRIDVYMQPLIEELKALWNLGAVTWDDWRGQNFLMKATLIWTVSDFPALSMLSGWSTSGKFACPVCLEDTKAFSLKHSRKTCWFDCHRRFLDKEHPFQQNRVDFMKGVMARRDEPPVMK